MKALRILGIIGIMAALAGNAMAQTQGVSVRATNGVAYGFLSQTGQAGSSNSVSIGGGGGLTGTTNGFDFNNGVNINVNGTNRMQFGGTAGNSNWVAIGNALGTNSLVVSAIGYTGLGTNPIHQLDVNYNTSNLVGTANQFVPAAAIYKQSNGSDNSQEVLSVDSSVGDLPYILIGRPLDGIDISWQRNGVVGGDHALFSAENTLKGLAIFQDGHLEVQEAGNGVLMAAGVGIFNGGINVGNSNLVGSGNANIQGTLLVHAGANFTGITSNEVATVGTFGVPTVFGVTNVGNTTGSITLGGIGTSPNLAGHSTCDEMMGTVQVTSATGATLTVAFAWEDEAGGLESTNIVSAAPLTGGGDLSLGPLIITTAAGTAVKISTTLSGTAQYSFHAIAIALVNN